MTNYILAFDTSIQTCSVALLKDNNLISLIKEDRPSMQAERLLPMIEEVLSDAKLQYQCLAKIAVTIGPGSFTGIRIGVAVAKGLRIATNLPIIPLTTLEVLATSVQAKDSWPRMAIIDAYRNQIYLQIFSPSGQELTEALLLDYQQAAALAPVEPFYLIGNGAHLLQGELGKLSKPYHLMPELNNFDASNIAYAAMFLNNTRELAPLYIRESAAKEIANLAKTEILP